jgi:hypothetical protein
MIFTVMKYQCEKCEKITEEKYGSGRFCSQTCARSFATKFNRSEISKKVSKKLAGKTGWNLGKTFEKKHVLACKKCGVEFFAAHPRRKFCDNHPRGRATLVHKVSTGIEVTDFYHRNFLKPKKQISEEQKRKLSETMKKRISENPELFMGGNRGRVCQIEVDGIRLHGKWELIFYMWAKNLGIVILRTPKGFPYMWNGERTYYPDFYIPAHNIYVEIKGYEKERDRAKWNQFPERLLVVKRSQIEKIKKGAIHSFELLLSCC